MSSPLASLGWDDQYAAELTGRDGDLIPARVARVDRGAVDVITADGPMRAELSVPVARADTTSPAALATDVCVGDWVALDPFGRLAAVLTRRTSLVRGRASGESDAQVLAANVDSVLVVVPAVPEPRPGMVERMVALVWDSGATPVVVVTKSDLSPDPPGVAADIAASAPGSDCYLVSATTDEGMAAVRELDRPGHCLCLLGRSGAGKSTLANAMLGEEMFDTAAVRRDGRGRHTTTYRQLVRLPGGALLVDTPGLRGVGLWIDGDGIDRAFPEIEQLVVDCRFSDCGHATEPGCAVLAAVDDGRLDERRLASWRKLAREAEWMAARSDRRLAAQRLRMWRAKTKEARPPRLR